MPLPQYSGYDTRLAIEWVRVRIPTSIQRNEAWNEQSAVKFHCLYSFRVAVVDTELVNDDVFSRVTCCNPEGVDLWAYALQHLVSVSYDDGFVSGSTEIGSGDEIQRESIAPH
ncbi:hypothetical protein TNCV_4414731 [Trichonephila clavipes]|uniref:Uncharacterized protein n=1 Tax=Trichonephila clavipes TaxID=2585209 RepID=A0A8X6VFQ5_TRICX|nr:hypothetical protein TNCV_4414731 [Trichonephila clavipes]